MVSTSLLSLNDLIGLSKKECNEDSPLRIRELGLTCWTNYFQITTIVITTL